MARGILVTGFGEVRKHLVLPHVLAASSVFVWYIHLVHHQFIGSIIWCLIVVLGCPGDRASHASQDPFCNLSLL
jgi:hypothetical protein